jgi:hypothetical protein
VGDGFNMINSEAVVQFANRNEVDRVTIHQSTGIDHKTIDDHAVIRSHCQVAGSPLIALLCKTTPDEACASKTDLVRLAA